MQRTSLAEILSDLTGQDAPRAIPPDIEVFGQAVPGLGFSQFNELLLLVGYDRVDAGFFQYLATGLTKYASGTAINDLKSLRVGVDRFRRMALLLFGNVKFAFKTLSKDADVLREWLAVIEPRPEASFHERHAPIRAIQRIAGEDTYFLGYLIQRDIEDRLKKNATDPLALGEPEQVYD